jgi:nitrogen PTS system EIIA component
MKDALKDSCIIADLKGETKEAVLTELVTALKNGGAVSDVEETVAVILEREKLGSTGIGEGIAIPHGKLRGIDGVLCAFGRSERGVDFDSVDEKPVHIIFLLLAPVESAGLHIQMLSRISRILRDASFRKHLTEQDDCRVLYEDIVKEDEKFGG